jgi:hypothetical protein
VPEFGGRAGRRGQPVPRRSGRPRPRDSPTDRHIPPRPPVWPVRSGSWPGCVAMPISGLALRSCLVVDLQPTVRADPAPQRNGVCRLRTAGASPGRVRRQGEPGQALVVGLQGEHVDARDTVVIRIAASSRRSVAIVARSWAGGPSGSSATTVRRRHAAPARPSRSRRARRGSSTAADDHGCRHRSTLGSGVLTAPWPCAGRARSVPTTPRGPGPAWRATRRHCPRRPPAADGGIPWHGG